MREAIAFCKWDRASGCKHAQYKPEAQASEFSQIIHSLALRACTARNQECSVQLMKRAAFDNSAVNIKNGRDYQKRGRISGSHNALQLR